MRRNGFPSILALALLLVQALPAPTGAATLRSVRLHGGGHFVLVNDPNLAPTREFSIQAWVWREVMDISDALATLNYLFLGTADSPCPDAMDANDDPSTSPTAYTP